MDFETAIDRAPNGRRARLAIGQGDLLRARHKSPSKVPAGDALLAIEVADSSETYDLGAKAKVYASFGVREYWVLLASSLTTIVHREPGKSGYGSIRQVPAIVSQEGARLRIDEIKS